MRKTDPTIIVEPFPSKEQYQASLLFDCVINLVAHSRYQPASTLYCVINRIEEEVVAGNRRMHEHTLTLYTELADLLRTCAEARQVEDKEQDDIRNQSRMD